MNSAKVQLTPSRERMKVDKYTCPPVCESSTCKLLLGVFEHSNFVQTVTLAKLINSLFAHTLIQRSWFLRCKAMTGAETTVKKWNNLVMVWWTAELFYCNTRRGAEEISEVTVQTKLKRNLALTSATHGVALMEKQTTPDVTRLWPRHYPSSLRLQDADATTDDDSHASTYVWTSLQVCEYYQFLTGVCLSPAGERGACVEQKSAKSRYVARHHRPLRFGLLSIQNASSVVAAQEFFCYFATVAVCTAKCHCDSMHFLHRADLTFSE